MSIVIKEFPNLTFANREDMFKALRENKTILIAQKRLMTKEADSTLHYVSIVNDKGEVVKAESTTISDPSKLVAKLVINTTNIMDSHSDVHLKGIWGKSVKENKNILLLQEHRMTFDHIITDSVKASIALMNWKDLGLNYNGTTEALIFDAEISKDRNSFMFEQYSKGYVKEHSVGMRYVKMDLALNSESKYDTEEKEVWDKYINEIVNKEQAEAQGYFWAVQEAKIIEGSAVVKGSNYATPTLSVESKHIEPQSSTQNDNESAENRTITEEGQKRKRRY